MPKRTDISTILIIGAGPIIIGQACEFDYAARRRVRLCARRASRRAGQFQSRHHHDRSGNGRSHLYRADHASRSSRSSRKSAMRRRAAFALLPTMGGQTALNCALSLRKMGVLEKYDVEMIGASAEAIDKAEDREWFREAMTKIGLKTPRSHQVKTLSQALTAVDDIGLPAIIRPSFTMGGTGGGIAYTRSELIEIVERGIDASPTDEVLIEESVLGWKEFEMEVVRDKQDNCIIVCSIENIDPMGVHTGNSITVAPALTLTDKEFQIMRDASIAVLRGEIGVETGGSNVQFAVNPADGRMVVIEMNPRVSRSSAFASKATGLRSPRSRPSSRSATRSMRSPMTSPAARRRRRLSRRSITSSRKSRASPSKVSRRRADADDRDEIGRRSDGDRPHVPESLQGAAVARDRPRRARQDRDRRPRPRRRSQRAARRDRPADARPSAQGGAGDAVGDGRRGDPRGSKIDPWSSSGSPRSSRSKARCALTVCRLDAGNFRALKAAGFSDARLAALREAEADVAAARERLGVLPVFKRIDTCAAEFASPTAYMYSTYEAPFVGKVRCEADPSEREKIVILGGGPNRIGQGIEFDYCCCHASFSLSAAGYETIMINCNTETASRPTTTRRTGSISSR